MIEDFIKTRERKIDATKFFNFYESKGWKVGKAKMVNWQASVITWEADIEKKKIIDPMKGFK